MHNSVTVHVRRYQLTRITFQLTQFFFNSKQHLGLVWNRIFPALGLNQLFSFLLGSLSRCHVIIHVEWKAV